MQIDSKNIVRTFWRFVIPTTAALLISGTYQIINGLFIGNFVEDGLAAMNMAWPPISFVLGFGLMVGVGVGALSSIEQGKKNLDNAQRYLAQLFWLLAFFSIFTMIVLFLIKNTVMSIQNATPKVISMGLDFLTVMSFATPVILGSIALPLVVRNLGSPILATISVIVGAFTNIFLDFLFIYKFGWGLKGAAIATVIGETFSIIICLIYIFSKRSTIPFKLSNAGLNLNYCKKIVILGFSGMITYVYIAILVMVYNALLMKYGKEVYVSVYAIIGYIITLYYLVIEGVANGMQPIVSFFYGAKKFESMGRVVKLSLKTVFIIGVFFTLTMQIFPEVLVSFFKDDPELIAVSKFAVRIFLLLIILDAFIVLMSIFFQSVGAARKAIVVSASNILIKLPFVLTLPIFFGVNGIWISAPISTAILTLLVIYLSKLEYARIKRLNDLKKETTAKIVA